MPSAAGLNGLDLNPGDDVILANDAAAIASSIEGLCADPATRKSMERNARATVESRYDWNSVAERQLRVYADLLRPSGSA